MMTKEELRALAREAVRGTDTSSYLPKILALSREELEVYSPLQEEEHKIYMEELDKKIERIKADTERKVKEQTRNLERLERNLSRARKRRNKNILYYFPILGEA